MEQKDLWNLFKLTGKIEYYLKYKNYKKEVKNNAKENKRDNY